MHFQKQDLNGTEYYWTEDSATLFTGQPSRRSFDRRNGNQLLFLINFYGSLSGQFTLQEGQQIEQKIVHELPEDAKSELSVFNWIRQELV